MSILSFLQQVARGGRWPGPGVFACCRGLGFVGCLWAAPLTSAQTLESVATFQEPAAPYGLVRGPDNLLYGVTQGGVDSGGTFFRMETNGTVTTLASFTSVTGTRPAGLTLGRDGNFYGTLRIAASTNQGGSIFKATPAGELTYVASLGVGLGFDPRPNLVEGEDGVFYGTTGGTSSPQGLGDAGSVFKVDVRTRVVTALKLFSITGAAFDEGAKPADGLARGTNGHFYGTCAFGGVNRGGTIFRITPEGGFAKLVDLGGVNGSEPIGTLLAASDGMLYGTAGRGGGSSLGTAFRVTTAGAFTRLTNFFGPTFGSPLGTLVAAGDGSLIGYGQIGNSSIAVFRLTTAGSLSLLATIPTVIVHGIGSAEPSLVIGADGAVYGARHDGGAGGTGFIFRVPLTGGWTTASSTVSETGFSPVGSLVGAADGHYYGVAGRGGPAGFGTVYRLTSGGTLHRVAHFTNADARNFSGRLVPGPDRALYGVSRDGGARGTGSAFRVPTNGVVETLVSFGGVEGRFPSPPVLGPDGALYGVTAFGPTADDGGRVYRVTTGGTLSAFASLAPLALGQPTSLLLASDGMFYGVAQMGIFRVTSNGVASVVAPLVGSSVLSPLVQGPDGHLYSTTYSGGPEEGAVLRVTRDGDVVPILDLAGVPGRNPVYGLTAGPDGLLYGVLDHDQSGADGRVLYRLTPGGFFTVLHNFNVGSLSLDLRSALTPGPGGSLYGVARSTVYRVSDLPSLPAYAQTGPAESVMETSAACTGEIRVGAGSVPVVFEFGLTTNYGQTVSGTPATVSGTEPMQVRAPLSGLNSRTTYHYRVRAGSLVGADRSFRTGPAPTLGEGLNAPGLTWTTGPANPWFLQTQTTFDGDGAAQSADVGDNGRSELRTTVTGPGRLTFRWKVSSEEDYDELFFYDEEELVFESISGETDWEEVSVSFPAGEHRLYWSYEKDGSDSGGLDTGWLDAVTWTPEGQITITQFTPLAGATPRYRLVWQSVVGKQYRVEQARTFATWTEVPGSQRTAVGALESIELDLGSEPPTACFYRVRQLP